jgi:hypothetical protein
MKKTSLLGLAQGKKNGFRDYTQPSKVSLESGQLALWRVTDPLGDGSCVECVW